MLAVPDHVEGRVVSLNKSANTVVIKDTKGKQFNLVADNDSVAELTRIKAGDQVEVTYKKSKDQMVATKISLTGSSNTSRLSGGRDAHSLALAESGRSAEMWKQRRGTRSEIARGKQVTYTSAPHPAPRGTDFRKRGSQ